MPGPLVRRVQTREGTPAPVPGRGAQEAVRIATLQRKRLTSGKTRVGLKHSCPATGSRVLAPRRMWELWGRHPVGTQREGEPETGPCGLNERDGVRVVP